MLLLALQESIQLMLPERHPVAALCRTRKVRDIKTMTSGVNVFKEPGSPLCYFKSVLSQLMLVQITP